MIHNHSLIQKTLLFFQSQREVIEWSMSLYALQDEWRIILCGGLLLLNAKMFMIQFSHKGLPCILAKIGPNCRRS